jgi:hypothetical protein
MSSILGGGSKTVQSNTGTQEPWSAAQPALKQTLAGAQDLYNSGAGSNTYQGSLVVPYAAQTKQGMSGIQNLANSQTGNLSQPMNQAIDTINRGGFNPTQQSAVNRMNAFAGGTGMNTMMTNAGKTLDNLNYEMQRGGGLTSYQQDALSRQQEAVGSNGYNRFGHRALGNQQSIVNHMMANEGLTGKQQSSIAGMQDLIQGGGYNAYSRDALGKQRQMANLAMSQGGLSDDQNLQLRRASELASGAEVMGTNPGFQRNLAEAQRAAKDAADQMSMSTGRYNSSTHQSRLSEDIGDITADMYSQEYNRQLQRQDAARNEAFNAGQAGFGNTTSAVGNYMNSGNAGYDRLQGALQGRFDMAQQGVGNRQGAVGDLMNSANMGFINNQNSIQNQFGMSQQGITNQRDSAQAAAQLGQTAYSNVNDAIGRQFEAGQVGKDNVFNAASTIPGAYNTMQQPYRDYMNIGGMQEDLQTRQMQDDLRKFRENDEAGWDRLSKLSAISSGAGALGNSTTGTVAAPTKSPFATALGGAIQGYDGNMFGGGLGGAAAGGALGFLGGF